MTNLKVHLVKLFSFIFFLSPVNSSLPDNTCHINVKVKQTLLNEGFHRNITFEIVFNTKKISDQWILKECTVGLDQILPAGVYVNSDELSDLRRINKINAIPKNHVNVELPAEQSEPNNVYILGKISYNKVLTWLPVHARYHQAVLGGGTARNEIEPPALYLNCSDQRWMGACGKPISNSFLCSGSSKEICNWKEMPYTLLTDTLIWNVPVGNLDHYYLVGIGTGLVVVVGSLYLLNTIHEYNLAAKRKRL